MEGEALLAHGQRGVCSGYEKIAADLGKEMLFMV